MKILFLAPQPFYTERGTPIAVNLILKALSARGEQVDVVTYHLGQDVAYEGVKIHRSLRLPFIQSVAPGFSFPKVICDIFLTIKVFSLVLRNRYQIVHAVEESVFIALLLKWLFRIPYVYDMDSSLSQQMLERYPHAFKPLFFVFNYAEGMAIRRAKAVVPVCDALGGDIEKFNPEKVLVLRDVSLLTPSGQKVEDLRQQLGIDGPLMMYAGNLESYQGIDLLLESFALTLARKATGYLVIIGGKEVDIRKYQARTQHLGISRRVHFLGPKPVEQLADYLSQADILVSPRVKGVNTPMKIYSYLDSGKALLATRLPTHTQVLSDEVAMLAEPTPHVFSAGVLRLVEDKNLRQKLGQAGKALAAERHTVAAFQDSLNTLYDWLAAELAQNPEAVVEAPSTAPGGLAGKPKSAP